MKHFLLFLFIIFSFLRSDASHFMGGNFSYKCLSDSTYEITLLLFRDCSSSYPFYSQEPVYFYSQSCKDSFKINLPFVSKEDITPRMLCTQDSIKDKCKVGGIYPGVEEWTYKKTVTFPKRCNDWVIHYAYFDRNYNIVNLKTSGYFLYNSLDNTNGKCDNSPIYTSPFPVNFVCVNQPVTYSFGTVDPDGDSLKFELAPALTGPWMSYSPVAYLIPYKYDSASSFQYTAKEPIKGMQIDTTNGLLSFIPDKIGIYVVAVKVTSYDSLGNWKGTSMRDVELFVQNCALNNPPDTSAPVINLKAPANQKSYYSVELGEEDSLSFDIKITDTNVNDTLTLSSNITSQLPGATITYSGINPVTATVKWKAPIGSMGTNTYFDIVAKDNACPFRGRQTYSYTVAVKEMRTKAYLDTIICKGISVQLRATGGKTFKWKTLTGDAIKIGTNFSCDTCQNPVATPSQTTSYEVTSNLTYNNKDTVTITVNNLPVATAGNDVAICIGNNTTLNASGGAIYAWLPKAGLSDSSLANPVANPTATTNYIVLVTDANKCSNTDTVKVTVNNLPVAKAGNDVAICNGKNTVLNASGGTSYSWSPTTGLSNANVNNPTANPTSTTTYIVTVTDANTCVNTNTVIVTVNNLPPASAGNDTAMCKGKSTTLNASGGKTYSWSPTTGLSNNNTYNPLANPTSTTTYTVTVTDSNGCVNTDAVVITIFSSVTAIASSDTTICDKDSAFISVAGTGTMFSWIPSTTLINSTTANPIATPSTKTTYQVTATDANGCIAVDSVIVTVNKLPVINAGTDAEICNGDSTTLSASGGTSYTWLPVTGLNNASIAKPVAQPTTTTNYIVTGTDANKCKNKDTVIITVNQLPNANAGTDVQICKGDSATLNAGGGSIYNWKPTKKLSNTAISNPVAFPDSTTSYTLIVMDAKGCRDTDTVVVTVNLLPMLTVSNDIVICPKTTTQLDASGGTSYLWTPSNSLSDSSIANPIAFPIATTTYIVKVSNGTCSAFDTIQVTVDLLKAEAFPSPSDAGYAPFAVTFNNKSIGADSSYQWSFGDKGTSALANPTHIYTSSGKYTVTLLVTNKRKCTDTINIIIEVNIKSALYIPTAFTPNKDGLNDIYSVGGDGIAKFKANIFNRWGEMIYEWNDIDGGWDGKFKGEDVPEGIYVLVVQARGVDKVEYNTTGTITVIR